MKKYKCKTCKKITEALKKPKVCPKCGTVGQMDEIV